MSSHYTSVISHRTDLLKTFNTFLNMCIILLDYYEVESSGIRDICMISG